MKLNIDKPIIFFDLETTGVNIATDRIVEISMMKRDPDGSSESRTQRINPTISIPASASEIHGIYDEDVVDKPTFNEVANDIHSFIEGCDLAGYNSNRFDIPLLVEEFLRADVEFNADGCRFIDIQVIFHQMEKRTLSAAYKFYCNKELVDAHSAEADVNATYEVLLAQLARYDELENNIDSLHQFTSSEKIVDFARRFVFDENGVEVFNFGKHKGKPVKEILRTQPGYYGWMMQGDFPLHTKKKLEEIKSKMLVDKFQENE